MSGIRFRLQWILGRVGCSFSCIRGEDWFYPPFPQTTRKGWGTPASLVLLEFGFKIGQEPLGLGGYSLAMKCREDSNSYFVSHQPGSPILDPVLQTNEPGVVFAPLAGGIRLRKIWVATQPLVSIRGYRPA